MMTYSVFRGLLRLLRNSFVRVIGTGRRCLNKHFVAFVINQSYLEITMILFSFGVERMN